MTEHHCCIFLKGETILLNKPDGKDRHHLNNDHITCDIGIRQLSDQNVRSDAYGYCKGEAYKLPYGKSKDYFLFVLCNLFGYSYFYGHPVAPFYRRSLTW